MGEQNFKFFHPVWWFYGQFTRFVAVSGYEAAIATLPNYPRLQRKVSLMNFGKLGVESLPLEELPVNMSGYCAIQGSMQLSWKTLLPRLFEQFFFS